MIALTDLSEVTLETLPTRVRREWEEHGSGLLTLSRRPSKRWTADLQFAHPLILSSAPLYELILWLNPDQLEVPKEDRDEQRFLLEGYRQLFAGELEVEEYIARLHQHIARQESGLFPHLVSLAPMERATRELGYEHRGLEKGAAQLAIAVADFRAGKLEKVSRERLDLDFYHLLEHHIERERDALIPAWKWLSKV